MNETVNLSYLNFYKVFDFLPDDILSSNLEQCYINMLHIKMDLNG